ncbi:MAG: aldehyde dehydrogenase family protein [Terriglobia bacterium]
MQGTMTSLKPRGFLLNGEWRSDGDAEEIHAPYDHKVVGVISRPRPEHLEQAIQAASQAFRTTRGLPSHERRRILRQVSSLIQDHSEELAHTMALEAGKPIRAARTEVARAVFTFSIAAEEAGRIQGEWLPMDLSPSSEGRWAMVRRFPVGPIAAITPFNFPLNLVAHKWAPAIATGCTIVHKPAPQTPLSALRLAELVQEAGWPAGGLNVLPLSNDDAQAMITDDRLKLLSFTGSARAGWALKAKAGKKRVTLELGGNAGVVVHRDADLEDAAARSVAGGYSYAGQTCISVQRVFVHRDVYFPFLDSFVARVRRLKMGDPLEESTDIGPLIRETDAERAAAWVDEAVRDGARILCGGQRKGSFLEPVVLTGTRPEMRVNREEVFAPVVTIEPYDDFSDALAAVNDSPYGLQAGIFTQDARLIFDAYERLEVGGVMVNEAPTYRVDSMPYGGVKDSGLGREGLRYAIEDLTEPKVLMWRTV